MTVVVTGRKIILS